MPNQETRNMVIYLLTILILNVHSAFSNVKTISPETKHENLRRRHLPFPGVKSGIIFSDEVSFPLETGEDLIQANANSAENAEAKDPELQENLYSVVVVSTTEYPPLVDFPKENIRREKHLTPGVKSLIATLKEDKSHLNEDEIKTMYKKIAVDFQVLQDLLSKQKPEMYQTSPSRGGSLENEKSNKTSNVLTIEDVEGRGGALTRITLVRRHILEKRTDLDLPGMTSRQASKHVKVKIQPEAPV